MEDTLKSVATESVPTPAYTFDTDCFRERVCHVAQALPGIPLTYSIKANPFLLHRLPEALNYVEVCSPGELDICIHAGIPGARIIYSGVNKEYADITAALTYGVAIATAESLKHLRIESNVAVELGITQRVILRLTSGNQFGMSEEDLFSALAAPETYPNLDIVGLHYYSGTQKKTRQIDKDFDCLRRVLETAKAQYGFIPKLVEYGPGLPVSYFSDTYAEEETAALNDFAERARAFAQEYPLGIEMGRFLATPCGTYATRVMDIKTNGDITYVICDGGIHHIKYYGQMMAMQVPPIEVLHPATENKYPYCLCGSLCTVADVLVRQVELPALHEGDILLFKRCGAYSITENSALFLSRNLPQVFTYSQSEGLIQMRGTIQASEINRPL